MLKELVILVISCDSYSDVWKPFFDIKAHFWPDCPYRTYLGTNELDFDYPGVSVVKSGPDEAWADNVRKHLASIEEDYVLVFLEDFFMCEKVITADIAAAFEIALRTDADLLSLRFPTLGGQFDPGEIGVYNIDPAGEYCISTSIAIWKKDALAGLLKPGYSAWDFEVKNSAQANSEGRMPGRFLSLDRNLFKCLNGVWRRKWVPSTLRFYRSIGIYIDTGKRSLMSLDDRIWEYFKSLGRSKLSESTRVKIKRIATILGFGHRFVS